MRGKVPAAALGDAWLACNLPTPCCPASPSARVLGLSEVADTVVGDSMTRGISGGQRKRVGGYMHAPRGWLGAGQGRAERGVCVACYQEHCAARWRSQPASRPAFTRSAAGLPCPRLQVTTAEILSGPQSVVLMDEISTGLDR